MGKKASIYTVFSGMLGGILVGWLVLDALDAGESAYLFVFVPFFIACYALSEVLHNNGFRRRRR